jgi:hypothetical protein
MTDKISQARDAESDEETGHIAGRKPGEQTRTTHPDDTPGRLGAGLQPKRLRKSKIGNWSPGKKIRANSADHGHRAHPPTPRWLFRGY